MKKYSLIFLITIIFISLPVAAQDNGIMEYLNNFSIKVYADGYYSWDNDKDVNPRQFSAISPYRDEFKINVAQASMIYNSDLVRGIVTLHYGDIPALSWPANQQNLQEASVGFSPVKNLWFDFGYQLTHIGAESLLPKNNIFSSLALGTYYEPFFQSGLKVSYEFDPKFSASFHLLNGYNVFEDNNKNKSFGFQFAFAPTTCLKLTYNNIIGNEIPSGADGKTRFYNNLVINYSPNEKLDFLGGFDFGYQEKSKISAPEDGASMFSGLLGIRYKINKKFSIGGRFEIISDPEGFLTGIITDSDGKQTGLKIYGGTVGLEYKPVDNAYLRFETRILNADSKQKIFHNGNHTRGEAMLTMGFEY